MEILLKAKLDKAGCLMLFAIFPSFISAYLKLSRASHFDYSDKTNMFGIKCGDKHSSVSYEYLF